MEPQCSGTEEEKRNGTKKKMLSLSFILCVNVKKKRREAGMVLMFWFVYTCKRKERFLTY